MQSQRRIRRLQSHLFQPPSVDNATVNREPTAATKLNDAYDFIVVGGGSAGCVAASRLSENPNVSVLLIEAGNSNKSFQVRSPMLTCPFLQNSERDWRFRTVPQKHMNDRVSFWPRGKTLGGCSSINFMLYVRGDPTTFDYWKNHMDCDNWGFEDVLPYFQKSESYLGQNGDHSMHGKHGPLHVTNMGDPHEEFPTKRICEQFVKACVECGLPDNPDYNGKSQAGAGLSQISVRDGVRRDTATSFLFANGAVKSRSNLTVVTDAMVTKILFQGDEAVGVALKQENTDLSEKDPGNLEKMRNTPTIIVHANKEVVLSAGAVGSPWLLMLSGVGPAGHLREKGIPVVKDLPVGENMQDHLFAGIAVGAKPGKHTGFSDTSTWDKLSNMAEYGLMSKGLFTYPYVQGLAFARSGVREEAIGNDIQIHLIPFIAHNKDLTEKNMGLMENPNQPVNELPSYGVTILPSLILPKSRGTVRLQSSDPLEYPLVDPNYLSDPDDVEALLRCYKLVRKVVRAPQLAEVLNDFEEVDEEIPHDPESDEYMIEKIKKWAVTIYHPTSTCKMGPETDETTVVNTRLQVHGLKRIRVACASVLPTVTSGNTNAPSIMVGERVADFLKQDWGL